MDVLRIKKFFSNHTMNCQTVVLLLKKIHRSLLICNKFCLGCSREWFFYDQIMDSGEKTVVTVVPFNYKWEESIFQKVMLDFDQQNTINISHSINRCFLQYCFNKI